MSKQVSGENTDGIRAPAETISLEDLRRQLARKAKALGSQAGLARQLKISPQFLSDIIRGNRAPGMDLLTRLGLKPVLSYQIIRESKQDGHPATN
jgi:hypothetical protein